MSFAMAQPPSSDAPAADVQDSVQSQESDARSEKEQEEYYDLLMVFADTLDQVERNYVEKVDRRELLEAAIEGVLRRLDPHSNYIAPDEFDGFKVEVENQFGGIGIQIGIHQNQIIVISPLVGTPAYRAGVQAGDIILAIDGKPTKNLSLLEATKLMKGRAGTGLTLTIFHPTVGATEDVNLTREIVKVQTVLGDRRKSDDAWDYMYDRPHKIGYLRINAFSRDTAADLRGALAGLKQDGVRGIVLDLRNNPGGLLRAAIEVSDAFLSEGTIVSTEGRNIRSQTWEAAAENTFDNDVQMVVLVNQFSASASEIVAAALQDHGRAIVVGTQTYGKASVQNFVELENGRSAIKLTTGSYRRPSGKPIHHFPDAKEWGVLPNDGFEVILSNWQRGRLAQQRRMRDVVAIKSVDGVESPAKMQDPQMDRAIEHLRSALSKSNKKSDE